MTSYGKRNSKNLLKFRMKEIIKRTRISLQKYRYGDIKVVKIYYYVLLKTIVLEALCSWSNK